MFLNIARVSNNVAIRPNKLTKRLSVYLRHRRIFEEMNIFRLFEIIGVERLAQRANNDPAWSAVLEGRRKAESNLKLAQEVFMKPGIYPHRY